MTTAITIQGLTKIYPGGLTAVDNLSLQVEAGQILAFLGPNGAGKTTTIKMICGLVTPTAGTVHLNGYHVGKQRAQAMRQIGVVLEGTRNIYWRLSAWDNLLYFGRLKGIGGKQLTERAQALLEQFDLWNRRDSEAGDFSRGMQQKLAIACALVADPPIILLDEPTLGLDVHAARTIKQQIQSLAQSAGKTILITTHDLSMAQAICEQVAIIRDGALVTQQPMRDLLSVFQRDYHVVTVAAEDLPADLLTSLSNAPDSPDAPLQTQSQNGTTRIYPLHTQAHLQHVLHALRDYQLDLVAVEHTQPSLEDIFIQLTHDT